MMKANPGNRKIPTRFFTHFLLLFLFVLAVLFPVPVWGAESDFRTRAYISLDASSPAYHFLELPDEVVSQTQPGLPDLRIYSNEEEIPYALITDQELLASARRERVQVLNKGIDSAGNLSFEIEIPQNRWIHQINFISPDKNFIYQVQVEGSRDEREWVNLLSDSTIFDLTKEQKSRHMEVNLPKTNFRYLRATVFRGVKGTLNLEGIELAYVNPTLMVAGLKERPYEFRLETSKDGMQECIFDLYHSRLPSRELEIITGAENFNRMAEIYDSENNKDWNFVTKGELYSYQLDKLAAKQLIIKFKTNRRYLKLKIYHQDNPPLSIREIKIRGINPALVFAADPAKKYFLYWNSNQIKAPIYDIQKFKDNLDYSKMPRVSMGPEEENKAFQFKDIRPWTERNSWLLQISLVAIAAVLLIVIFRSIRSISSGKGNEKNRKE